MVAAAAEPRAQKPTAMPPDGSVFRVIVAGELVECDMPFSRGCSLLARFEFVYGADWAVVSGTEHGITQTATPSKGTAMAVWNHPLNVAFTARNASGWPQLVVAVFGADSLGRDVVRGYAAEHVPPASGQYERWLPMWTPQHASMLEGAVGMLTGRRAEYVDPKFAARGPGREVTRTQSLGRVKVVYEVIINGMNIFGFSAS